MKRAEMLSPLGKITIIEDEGKIVYVLLPGDDMDATLTKTSSWPSACQDGETPVLKAAVDQLEAYFAGHSKNFELPINPRGTAFMQAVWAEMLKIPYGETATYGELAARIGRPKASRAVGMACNRNPIPIVIPCHRVVGAKGVLTGFRGGLDIKQKLLNLESDHHN